MYQIQTIMGPKLSKIVAKAFSEGHNNSTQHSASVSSQNQQEKLTLQCMMLSAICFSCAGTHQETLSYL